MTPQTQGANEMPEHARIVLTLKPAANHDTQKDG